MPTLILPHDPAWARRFEVEVAALSAIFGPAISAWHHIGSTAVPGLLAKPIIDILGVAPDLAVIDTFSSAMREAGYEVMGPYGIDGRRYFRKSDLAGRRSHHLHVFAEGSSHIARHLAFRDYLIARPEIAAEYGALKRRLAGQGDGLRTYADGKDSFMKAVEAEALDWVARGRL